MTDSIYITTKDEQWLASVIIATSADSSRHYDLKVPSQTCLLNLIAILLRKETSRA